MNLRDLVSQVVAERLPVQVVPGKVLRIDQAAATCDVQPLEQDAPPMFDVRLRAAEVEAGPVAGFVAWPAKGSVVLVGLVDNDLNSAFVAATSEVESFTLSTGEESLLPWLQDLGDVLRGLVLLTNSGATTGVAPTSLQALVSLFDRLPKLLTK